MFAWLRKFLRGFLPLWPFPTFHPKRIEVKVMSSEPKQDQLSLPPSPLSDLQQTFIEVFRDANEERIRQEQELLNDEKLRGFIKKAFKKLAKELPNTSGDDILFNHEGVGINAGNWPTFVRIFCGVCKGLGIEARWPNHSYIFVNKNSLIKAIENMHVSEVDVDQRIAAMLHSGPSPYR